VIWLPLACLVLLIVIARRKLLLVTVDGLSMLPTLDNGQRVLVWRGSPDRLRQGQIVVFGSASDASDGLLVKRLIALPGDPMPLRGSPALARFSVVPTGYGIVAGDNRAGSRDSRDFGPLPLSAVTGVVIFHFGRKGGASMAPPLPFN
jgi:signal peptidase I